MIVIHKNALDKYLGSKLKTCHASINVDEVKGDVMGIKESLFYTPLILI